MKAKMRMNISVPDELAAAVRRAGIPVSQVAQAALRQAVASSGTDIYSVHVEARAPAGARQDIGDGAADALMDLLEDHSVVVSAGDRSWDATISVPGTDPAAAAAAGAALVAEMAAKAGMPSWPLVRCEAVREDMLDEDLARPALPGLVSVLEAAEILGVSPQRIHELARTPGFPEPAYELKTGRLWFRAGMEAYAQRRS
jgi:post-segregation antitoxin (ccd killing protein)